MLSEALMSSKRHDWQTPRIVLDAVRLVGPILLDPCSTPSNPVGAAEWLCPEHGEDGLTFDWETDEDGLVYVNPPYGRELPRWVNRCVELAERGLEVIALVPSRTDTRWWHQAFASCQAVALWRGRITFVGAPGPAPFPSCLFYWGDRERSFARAFCGLARVVRGGVQ